MSFKTFQTFKLNNFLQLCIPASRVVCKQKVLAKIIQNKIKIIRNIEICFPFILYYYKSEENFNIAIKSIEIIINVC